jgi:hypothetical protein
LVQPGEIFVRNTGAVWFTISAVVSPDNVSHYTDWSVAWPIAAVIGGTLLSAITAGYGAFAAVGASVGASALTAGGAVSLSTIVVGDALAAGGATTLYGGTAVKLLGDVFAENGMKRRYGMYAGPPWPFREDTASLAGPLRRLPRTANSRLRKERRSTSWTASSRCRIQLRRSLNGHSCLAR